MTRSTDAPGQLAGYLFQIERALFWLTEGGTDSVGIEAGDDVVRLAADDSGTQVREQDKHSTSERVPFSDTGIDLWKTLCIWIEALPSDQSAIPRTRFLLVTNKIVPKSWIAAQLADANSNEQAEVAFKNLQEVSKTLSQSVSPKATELLAHPKERVVALIKQIDLSDGADSSSGHQLRTKAAQNLHIPTALASNSDQILDGLCGWVYRTALDTIRGGRSVWIQREHFDNQYYAITERIRSTRFRETAKNLIAVPEGTISKHRDSKFIRQILLVCPDDNDEVTVEAIEDFFRASTERSRISFAGFITKEDFLSFDQRLIDRWINIFRRSEAALPQSTDSTFQMCCKNSGWSTYLTSMEHRELLASQPTEEYYLTRGSYHALADRLQVGWHPKFEHHLSDEDGGEENGKTNS